MRLFSLCITLLSCCFICHGAHDWHAHTLQQKDGLSSNNIECIFRDSYGFMWFGTSNGINRYDAARIRTINLTGLSVTSISEAEGVIYVGTADGLFVYGGDEEGLTPFNGKTSYQVMISSSVTDVVTVGNGVLVVGTYGQGLFFYDTVSRTLRQTSIGIPFITDITVSEEGDIYVSEENSGIHIVSARGDYISKVLPRKSVSRLMVSGHVLYYLCESGSVIGRMKDDRVEEKRLSLTLNDFCSLSTEKIVLSTTDGLYEMDKQTFGLRPFVLTGHGEDLSRRSYGDVFIDAEGTMWVASQENGVIMISEKNNFLRDYPLPRYHDRMRMTEDENRNIRVFTESMNYILKRGDDAVMQTASAQTVTGDKEEIMCIDLHGNTYKAVGKGVYWSSPLEKDKKYHILGHDVENLCCDKAGQVWAGTSGKGLWLLKDDKFVPFDLSSIYGNANLIYSMEEDQNGYLWVCSDIGIVKLDPENRDILTIIATEEARSDNGFLYRASLRSSDGVMYFGRREGILSFFPSGNLVNKVEPKVTINSMMFRNGKASINDLYKEKEIRVPYSCNSFTLSFSVHSYQDPQNNTCSYSMSSVDEQEVWSRETTATYNHLSPGRYTFTVKGKNNDGVESERAAVLRIIITPPWWLSRLAFVIYTLLIGGGIIYAYRLWKRRFDRKYTERLRHSREVIEREAYHQKINFFLGMVHEIRTPLTMIRLALDNVIESRAEDTDSVRSLRENLNYLQETVNGILTFHKRDSQGTALILSRTDMVRMCRNILARFHDSAKLRNIVLRSELPDSPVYVMADESFLSKIVINLLGNAFKYAGSQVTLSLSECDGHALIKVTDDGPGVRDEEKEKIFEMFYKASGDKIAEASGLGVGLAYSRKLAQDHDGTLVLDDTHVGGASFVLRLPLVQDNYEVIENMAGDEDVSVMHGDKLKVVVVDDNVELVTNLERLLSKWYSVRVAYNGEEALKVIEQDATDIVVSDVMMPVMDGIELCRQIKDRVEFSHIPFIMLTAKINVDDKAEGLESGADAYVEKPFSISQLHHQIENLIRLRNSLREKVNNEVGRTASEMPKLGNQRDNQFVAAINAAIEEQIRKDDFSVDALADTMCMSKANFYRKFQAMTGTSPNEYLKNYRLNRAASMIADGARINEAAEAVGFYSSSYFAKCFKAKFGVLPKDYLKN